MIKVGICGCDNLPAAELVRTLINHPDVDLRWVCAAVPDGTRLDSIVPGLIGDTDLETIAQLPQQLNDDIDVAFVCDNRYTLPQVPELVRLIDMTGCNHDAGDGWTCGMPEMMRRTLVHDCYRAFVPGCATIAALLALLPLARNLLLNAPIDVRLAIASSMLPAVTGGTDAAVWLPQQQQQLSAALGQCQNSFSQPLQISLTPLSAERRVVAAAVRMRCAIGGKMLQELFEQYYNDHNFVFIVDRPIAGREVENTNKCLLRLIKDDSRGVLTVHIVMDALLKGTAGTAIHDMNLMFGLYERVGLMLKATGC